MAAVREMRGCGFTLDVTGSADGAFGVTARVMSDCFDELDSTWRRTAERSPVSSAFMSAMDEHTDRQRLADELDRAIHEAAMVRHRLRLSPTPRRLDPDDPISRADAAVEAARSALRTLDELDESGSSRN